jgi:magnesium transporter
MFQIHILALEDVVNVHQRAKVEPYENLLYVVVRVPNDDSNHPTEQISLFLGRNFVLTFQEFPGDCFDPIRVRMRNQQSEIRNGCQADYLAYRLIDSLIDSYFPVLEKLGDRLDDLDDLLIQSPNQEVFAKIHGLKGELQMLRRASWPLRDVLGSLMRDPTELVSDSTRVYWRDCYDHSVQIIDLVETYREVCADLRDFYLSSISNRMNEIMKVLTVIATIFMPLSFIVGVYGMNFNPEASPWNMPELNSPWGYRGVWGVMCMIAGGMLFFFWRKGWLGHDND